MKRSKGHITFQRIGNNTVEFYEHEGFVYRAYDYSPMDIDTNTRNGARQVGRIAHLAIMFGELNDAQLDEICRG